MRKLLTVFTALALLLPGTAARAAPTPAPSPPSSVPYEERRFARVAAEVAKDPLYVDMDLADFVDGETRAGVRTAMARTSRALGVPVYFVAIPNDSDSESFGKIGAFLAGLHTHLRRDGLFLMADATGTLDAAAYGVPRRFGGDLVPYRLTRAADRDRPFADLAPRVTAALSGIAAAPAGPAATHAGDTGVPPFGQELPPVEADLITPSLTGLLLAGPLAAVLLYGLILLVPALRRAVKDRSRPASRPWHSSPSRRWLRSQAGKELKALRGELDPDRPGMLRAYDAAKILYDDVESRPVKTDDSAFLDLVGVIVLARQGREARTRERPVPTCFVNPLHGDAGGHRRKISNQGRQRVCDPCADGGTRVSDRVLRLPDRRPHYTVPGRWQQGAFGSRTTDLPGEVLESLGVET